MNKNCQSCGMPLSKDPQCGGTESDGTKSKIYCSYCYDDGGFLQQNITASDMQDLVKKKLISMGIPRFIAWLMILRIPRMHRWRDL